MRYPDKVEWKIRRLWKSLSYPQPLAAPHGGQVPSKDGSQLVTVPANPCDPR